MKNKYEHVLTPIKVGNMVLKNRLMATQGILHFLQGPEDYPSDAVINYYAGLARNGASVVLCRTMHDMVPRLSKRGKDGQRGYMWDNQNPAVENYMSQIADVIHFYGSKACINIQKMDGGGYNISKFTDEDFKKLTGMYMVPRGEEIPIEKLQEMKADVVKQVVFYKSLGYDMVNLYMSYLSSIFACSLSPLINKRTDQYGGSFENRCRLVLELCREIKDACGKDFPIMIQMSCWEEEGGYTLEDTINFCKLAEGLVDILHIKSQDAAVAHPVGFNSNRDEPDTLVAAAALKASGTKIIIAPNGGYQNVDQLEKWIAEGKIDMALMCRSFIADHQYMKKIYEGRGDDVVPCVRCNKCHVASLDGPWISICSVNPEAGIENRLDKLVMPVEGVKKVAVIGGGPAGMRAALECRLRGHEVTLYEKTGYLGGQLRHSDYATFKWPLMDFKNWLVYQLNKQGVKIVMNTEPTPEMIEAENFDAVIAATGAVPKKLSIPGAEKAWTPIDVFGREAELGKKVVIVGGAETGVETGLYLVDCGHEVVVLSRQKRLAPDTNPIHYREMMDDYIKERPAFSYVLQASTTKIGDGFVAYTDADGNEHTVECDSVVISGGVRPLQDEALRYAGTANKFFMAGDCTKPGNVHDCNREAFAAASQI